MITKISIVCFVCLIASGCQTVGEQAKAVQKAEDDTSKITVGTVQREIKIGMNSSDVIQALGSPNIITTDDQRQEVWVYDKISTSNIRSASSGGINLLIIGNVTNTGASSTSQRTLTIIIKFDKDSRVRDFSYHTSRF